MPTEPDNAPTCDECGGTPDACICEALDRVLDDAPTPPQTAHGYDHLEGVKAVIRESNAGHPAGPSP